jgi:hypothetical protein
MFWQAKTAARLRAKRRYGCGAKTPQAAGAIALRSRSGKSVPGAFNPRSVASLSCIFMFHFLILTIMAINAQYN